MKLISALTFCTLLLLSCEPKKEEAPAPILGKSFVEFATPASNVMIGDSIVLVANYINEKNIVSQPSFSWVSSKPAVATVSQSGVVRAVTVGQVYVIADFNSFKDTLIITVLPKNVLMVVGVSTVTGTANSTAAGSNTSTTVGGSTMTTTGANVTVSTVIIVAASATMALNSTQQLQAQLYNSNSELVTGKSVSWTSSDNSILEVSSSGLVSAKKSGVATIQATSEGVNSLRYSINVSSTMRAGSFVGVGRYSCSGSASIKYNAGGNLVVEFGTDFSVQSGPDLYVYLSNAASGSGVNTNGLQLAVIGTNSGARTYTTPAGTDIAAYKYVVVHCKQFSSTFGYAELK